MTIGEAIERIDRLKENQYEKEDKVKWLSDLDKSLIDIVFSKHEDSEVEYSPYEESENADEIVLLVPDPYSELYISLLNYKIDYFNGEYERFNNAAMMYNLQLQDFMNYWNREHKPLQENSIKMR